MMRRWRTLGVRSVRASRGRRQGAPAAVAVMAQTLRVRRGLLRPGMSASDWVRVLGDRSLGIGRCVAAKARHEARLAGGSRLTRASHTVCIVMT